MRSDLLLPACALWQIYLPELPTWEDLISWDVQFITTSRRLSTNDVCWSVTVSIKNRASASLHASTLRREDPFWKLDWQGKGWLEIHARRALPWLGTGREGWTDGRQLEDTMSLYFEFLLWTGGFRSSDMHWILHQISRWQSGTIRSFRTPEKQISILLWATGRD